MHSIRTITQELQKKDITIDEIIDILIKIDLPKEKLSKFIYRLAVFKEINSNQDFLKFHSILYYKRNILDAKPIDGLILSIMLIIKKFNNNKDYNCAKLYQDIKNESNYYVKKLSFFYKIWDIFQGKNSIQKINTDIQKAKGSDLIYNAIKKNIVFCKELDTEELNKSLLYSEIKYLFI